MRIRLICVPYHLGRRDVGLGAGPARILAGGAEAALRDRGHEVRRDTVAAPDSGNTEIGAAFEVNRRVAERVRKAASAGELPLVLAGDCNSSVGTLAGIGTQDLGVVWFDAHGDFNTPETTASGNFDGMALSVVTGACWTRAAADVRGFAPVPEERVVLAAIRDLDAGEEELIASSAIGAVPAARFREDGARAALGPALERLSSLAGDVYLHLDLDALDTSEGRANAWAAAGGLSVQHLEEAVELVAGRFRVRAAALTAYDPACDPDGKALASGIRLLAAVADAAGRGAGA